MQTVNALDKDLYDASVVITTLNRKDDLRRLLGCLADQTVRIDTIVIDDGSCDGTSEMVRREFPCVRSFRSEVPQGSARQRNYATSLAKSDIVFSFDDDVEIPAADTIARTLFDFDDQRVGAVFIPIIDTFRKREYGIVLPDQEQIYVIAAFAGCAYAVRRSIFNKVGGFREGLFMYGEEGEFCIRMLDDKFFVRCGSSRPVFHHVSPIRDLKRINFLSARNAIIFAHALVPASYYAVHFLGTTVMHLISGARSQHIGAVAKGLFSGYVLVFTGAVTRCPVSGGAYRLTRHLRRCGIVSIAEAERRLVS